jgi:guanylate kinase
LNIDVLEQDSMKYQQLKLKLLKNSAIVGLIATVVVSIVKGTEDAAIYLAGVAASMLYLLFLSLKTDTIATGSTDGGTRQRLGSPFANLRFFMPVLLLVGVALYNKSLGDQNPLGDSDGMFDTVTKEQFAVAVLGFLTYRVPLFVGQIQDAFAEFENDEKGAVLPGSAGVALQALKQQQNNADPTMGLASTDDLVTVLLVSGPQGTGRSELVEQLLQQNDDRLVAPKWLLRRDDGASFERLERRNEFLATDETSSSGLTKNSVFEAAAVSLGDDENTDKGSSKKVVVVDASVDLAKKLQTLSGTRLIGVWVGLQSVSDFEERIKNDIDSGKMSIPPEETEESVVRARIKEIINEIEYGLGSGIFEFTILNQDPEQSLKELKRAAEYAFK